MREKWLVDTIVIDAGHGGKDPGAIGIGGLQEKTITLDVAKKFLSSGAKVFIWDIDENELIKATKEINNSNLEYNLVDVSNFQQIVTTVKKIITNKKIQHPATKTLVSSLIINKIYGFRVIHHVFDMGLR